MNTSFPLSGSAVTHPVTLYAGSVSDLEIGYADFLQTDLTAVAAPPVVVAMRPNAGGPGINIYAAVNPAPTTNPEGHAAHQAAIKNLSRIALVIHDPESFFTERPATPVGWTSTKEPLDAPAKGEKAVLSAAHKRRRRPKADPENIPLPGTRERAARRASR